MLTQVVVNLIDVCGCPPYLQFVRMAGVYQFLIRCNYTHASGFISYAL